MAVMRIYRAVTDIKPEDVNHRWIGDAVYGRGTYFALSLDVAERYLNHATRYKVVFTYDCAPNNAAKLSTQDIPALGHFLSDNRLPVSSSFKSKFTYSGDEITGHDICRVAQAAGYDCLILTGAVEGGEQLIIPEGSSLAVVPSGLSFAFRGLNEKIRNLDLAHLEGMLGIKIRSVLNGWVFLDIELRNIQALSSFLCVFEKLGSGCDVLSCDFKTGAVEYCDED
jgi:hypothetical protein